MLLYLFDQSRGRAEREDLYLPLAESYQKQGEYARASEYSENYLKRYPQGDDAGPHYQILLDSLARQERNQELLEWLRKGDRPTSVDLEKRAAQAYWDQGDYLAVIDSLNKVMQMGGRPASQRNGTAGRSQLSDRSAERCRQLLSGPF